MGFASRKMCSSARSHEPAFCHTAWENGGVQPRSDGSRMTDALRLVTALGLHVCAAAIFASVAVGQPLQPLQPPSAAPHAEPAKVRLEDLPNIVFYVAKGEANACGH